MDLSGKHIGNYVAKNELGSGGMGVVYLCEHPLIKRRVAAKVLHEELAASEEIVRRLFAEAKAANEIASEHIIEVLDFGRIEEGGRELVYLLMEFLEGEALGHRLWRVGLTIDESLHIVSQCCEALEASHKVGIVHRDLKPENIFLVERRGDPNFVKILDFGIAKVSGNPSTKTRTGVLLGTPAYMSPEQCRGSGAVDARADVYSLGIVLYELTTGDVPFNAEGYGQVLMSQMTEAPRPPTQINRDLPKVVEEIVLRALRKDPDERYQSMAELGQAIKEAEGVLQGRDPISQIPRKGLHQRETFVAERKKRSGSVAGALAHLAPTPIDAALQPRMAAAAADAPTQMMGIIDPDSVADVSAVPGTLQGLQPSNLPAQAPATIVDREVPAHVAAAILVAKENAAIALAATGTAPAPAPALQRSGQAAPSAEPQGASPARSDSSPIVGDQASPLISQVPTVLTMQAPTLIRAADPAPTPTAEMDERAVFPRTGRYILIGATLVALIGVALALLLR